MTPYTIQTERMILRPWKDSDLEPWIQLNLDPRVMEFFPSTQTPEESEAGFRRVQAYFKEHGFGFWAVEIPGEAPFAGFLGIKHVNFEAPFTPAYEIGWRLAHRLWGKGYAPEGALATLRFARETLNLQEVVSFTAEQNLKSRRVMEKIGMFHDLAGDFDHPNVPEGHPLRRHVLYRIQLDSSEKSR